jgi:hypothetical protein
MHDGVQPFLFGEEAWIMAADAIAWEHWPDEPRHYTYIDPHKMAGWRKCGVTKRRNLIIMEIRHERA